MQPLLVLTSDPLSIEHLLPLHLFHAVMDDFISLLYPITPIICIRDFRAGVAVQRYQTDPAFLRLCFSLVAITVSSLSRKFAEYGFPLYANPKEVVDRAHNAVMASRLLSDPHWDDTPSLSTMICSFLLAGAAHYTQRRTRAWALLNESIAGCRDLKLYRKEGYKNLTEVDAQISKRLFWLLYITQV